MSKLPDSRRWQGWDERGIADMGVVDRYDYCAFSVEAPLEQAREAFAEHVCDRPRRPPASARRRRSGFLLR